MVYISVINTQTLQIFNEKFSPLRGFESGTSPVPSRYAHCNKNSEGVIFLNIDLLLLYMATIVAEKESSKDT